MSVTDITRIEQKRADLGVSRAQLERLANVSNGYVTRALAASSPPRDDALARLRLALARLQTGEASDAQAAETLLVIALIRSVTVILCRRLPAAPAPTIVHASDPSRRATQDPVWRQAAAIRNQAWAIVNQCLGVSQVQIATAANVSRAAVCRAIRQMMEDDAFEELLEAIGDELAGDAL